MTDKEKRDQAVDRFAQAIKLRLDVAEQQGKTGWTGAYPAERLRADIFDDADAINFHNHDDKVVDVAARCMMLWFRNTSISNTDQFKRGDDVTFTAVKRDRHGFTMSAVSGTVVEVISGTFVCVSHGQKQSYQPIGIVKKFGSRSHLGDVLTALSEGYRTKAADLCTDQEKRNAQ